ncbi:MAG: LysR family transcriptional regulator [Actinomycetota bacterium]|nr:LysR family transcriptional regulator [Actinomycetota bacterium]
MDIRQLTYFLGIVEHGGFGRAAEHLHVAQPSLSQAVAGLERDLGVRLFHRLGRGVELTEAGRALIAPARRVLRDLDSARARVDSIGGQLVGQVDLALMPSQGVEPFATMALRLARRHPGLRIRADPAYTRDEVLDLVRSGRCELGLAGAVPAPYPSGFVAHRLGTQDMVLVVAPEAGFQDGAVVSQGELGGQRLIVSPPGSVMRQVADEIAAVSDVHIAVEVAHRSSVLPLVLSGAGVAVLSSAWTSLARRSGAFVLQLCPTSILEVAIIHRDAPLTPAAEALLDISRQPVELES